jgi:hypothetical protein
MVDGHTTCDASFHPVLYSDELFAIVIPEPASIAALHSTSASSCGSRLRILPLRVRQLEAGKRRRAVRIAAFVNVGI